MKRRILTTLVSALGLILCPPNPASAVPSGTAFTYQGRLSEAESRAGGLYDFQFKLYVNVTDGNQKGNQCRKESNFGVDTLWGRAYYLRGYFIALSGNA